MNTTWLEELLPPEIVSSRTKIWWLLFFLLFPLAYVGGVMLEQSEEGPAKMMHSEDRAASIRKAAEFAAGKGFPVTGWHQYALVEIREDLLAYYDQSTDAQVAAANEIAPAREIQVLFRSPDQSHEFRVYLSLSGDVTGFDFGKSTARTRNVTSTVGVISVQTNTTSKPDEEEGSMKNAIRLSDKEAESVARAAMAENKTLSGLVPLGQADVASNGDDPARKEVSWDPRLPKNPGLKLHVSVSVRDGQIVAQHIEASVDKQYIHTKKKVLPIVFNSIYSLFLTFGAFYAIWRYAKRTLQKEVSHLRTLVVAGLFMVSYSVLAYSIGYDQVAARVSGDMMAKIAVASEVAGVVTCAFIGLLVGIAYGSGEGELREAYPGKLTSLDALLAGRIFSKDVAASVLFGAASAAWLLLCQRALGHFLSHDFTASRNDVLTYTFARLPWLTLLVGRQYHSLLVAVTGLLLPASFLLRKGAKKKRRIFWLILFATFSVTHDAAKYQTAESALLALVIFVSALLLPFFGFDLLAAIVSLSALAFVEELARLSAVFPSWSGLADWLAAVAAILLATATYLALRGRRVTEAEVSPLYAKNLAERMSLQAEVLAAREAQLRLLPQAVPELAGAEFAACCLPAREVGGDFYDFFRLDSFRVGIFVAQGGEEGLASALCIALAKGVLMHSTLQPQTPTQILLDLEASMDELLEGGSGISIAYGVLDTNRNTLHYARIGAWPRVVVVRGDETAPSVPLERLVSGPKRLKDVSPIYEGSVTAQPADLFVMYTRGVTNLRLRRFGKREFGWLDVVRRDSERQNDSLQLSLSAVLSHHQSNATADLTAVVIRVKKSAVLAQEGVA